MSYFNVRTPSRVLIEIYIRRHARQEIYTANSVHCTRTVSYKITRECYKSVENNKKTKEILILRHT